MGRSASKENPQKLKILHLPYGISKEGFQIFFFLNSERIQSVSNALS